MLLNVFLIGFISTFIADLITIIVKTIVKIPSLDFAWVGRWVLYINKGQYWHQTIIQSPALPYEKIVGWLVHYLIGIITAGIMLWSYPLFTSILSIESYAFLFGIITIILPFAIMQPAFGFGFAACKTPQPNIAHFRSFLFHLYLGFGLCLATLFVQ